MSKKNPSLWNTLITVVLIAGAMWTYDSRVSPGAQAAARRGFKSAPDFTLAMLDGSAAQLGDLRGRPVILNFWATWCPPCRAELPAFEAVHQALAGRGLVIVAVAVDEPPEVVARYAGEMGLTLPIALDLQGRMSEFFRVQGLPTTVFIDRNGAVKDLIVGGPLPRATIESKAAALLAEP